MVTLNRPLVFEDKTGNYATTDLDDIYDRMFLRVVQHSILASHTVILIYDRARRGPSHSHSHSGSGSGSTRGGGGNAVRPSVVLDLGVNPKGAAAGAGGAGGMGTITFENQPPLSIRDYLKKVGAFGSSLNRRFRASDSNEYQWSRRAVAGQEWSCFNAHNQVIAHYDLKDPEEASFRTSGNCLVIQEHLLGISVEILATLIIMRHIEHHRL